MVEPSLFQTFKGFLLAGPLVRVGLLSNTKTILEELAFHRFYIFGSRPFKKYPEKKKREY